MGARESFGYRDDRPKSSSEPEPTIPIDIQTPGLEGGTWLLQQRYVQDTAKFEKLTDAERDAVFGRDRKGGAVAGAPASSHAPHSAAFPLVRRGFAYRK